MKLYNSASRKKEDFVPNHPDIVKMYTCGPTVYHYAHIGNLRSYIMEDVLEKHLRYVGYNVKRVMNITDVGHLTSDADEGEDKMLKGAKRENKSVMDIAKFYTDAFFADCAKLNIKTPDVVEPATNCIDEYIKIITRLMDTGYAYFAGGNVYFDTSKLEKYYIFNDFNADDLDVGVREGVEEDTNKRNKNDFVLWFTKSKFEDQALKWDSPWGVGYPGWHIECSGISMKHLGEDLDIHCGGIDNAFPHHTNEIAQSESYLGHKWCSYWMHVMHLNTNSGKMSKSKGNVVSPDDLVRDYGCDSLRLYELFVGPPELDSEWDDRGIDGVYRFLTKFWKLVMDNKDSGVAETKEMVKLRHKMVFDITQRLENFSLNTVISGFMEYNNKMIEMAKNGGIDKETLKTAVVLLAPFAPHIAEELWRELGGTDSVFHTVWPTADEEAMADDEKEIAVQVNGKTRVVIKVPADISKEDAIAAGKAALGDKLTGNVIKEIYVPGRIINIVAK